MTGYPLLQAGGVYPVPVLAVLGVYRWLLDRECAAHQVAFAGDSAGAWLAVTGQLRGQGQGLPRPAAAILISPLTDMEGNGESLDTGSDPFFHRELVRGLAAGFLGEAGTPGDPLVTPVHADLSALSPLYIQAGGDEALLDDARRLHQRAVEAGVDSRLDIFPGMLHTFQMAAGRAPEADDAVRRMAEWVRPRLGL